MIRRMQNLLLFAVVLAMIPVIRGQSDSSCNFDLKAALAAQTIMTPNFPTPYNHSLNCTWHLWADKGNQIELKFSVLDIESVYDILTIYDGENSSAPVLKTLYGNIHLPTPYLSSKSQLFLSFKSDNSFHKRGFRAQFRIALRTKINIKSIIQSCLADTTIASEVYNHDTVPREVEFRAIFPRQAYITKFHMTLNGIDYVGEVQKKEYVKEKYERSEIQGITMGFVSSTKDLAKTFFTSVLLQPGKTVSFQITYQQLLQRRLGRYTNTLVLTRDYLIHDLTVDIYICARSNLTFLQVPPMEHAGRMSYIGQVRFLGRKDFAPPDVTMTKNGNIARITYKSVADGGKRSVAPAERTVFVLHYDVDRGDSGTLSVTGGKYFATFFSPNSPNLVRRIVFVLDVSGSMAGNKINQVKIAMRNILAGLSKRDLFNVVQFESVVRKWKNTGLIAATATAKASAQKYIESFDPEGKTNIHEALMTGLKLLEQGSKKEQWKRRIDVSPYRDFVFFLGDGKPTMGIKSSAAILKAVEVANQRGYGVNAIGFGKNVDIDFLQRLTRDNHGQWRIIFEDEDSHLQIQNFIAQLGSPIMTDVDFSYSPSQVNYTTKRSGLALVSGGEVAVFGRLADNMIGDFLDVKITGKTFKRIENTYRFPILHNVSQCTRLEGEQVNEFAARGYGIAKLEETLMKVRQNTDPDDNEKLTDEAADISLEFHLVSPVTSLVVKRPENQTRDESQIPDDPIAPPPDDEGVADVLTDNPKEKEPPSIVNPLPESSKPWVFEGDPHFIVELGHNITVCFTWNGTDGEIYNLLEDTDHGVVLNGQIKYGPSATHKSKNSECSDIDEDVNESAKDNGEHLCNRDIESFFVKLGFVFTEEKLKIAVTPKEVLIIDETDHKHPKKVIFAASDDAKTFVRGHVGIVIYNITKVHSFVNITLNETVTFVINLKRNKDLPPEKNRVSLIDHLDMVVVGQENLSPYMTGLFGVFPNDIKNEVDTVKKSRYPTARLRRPGKHNLLQYRKHNITVDKISIADPYTKKPHECWFTYDENDVTGKTDDAFKVSSLFQI